MSTKTNSQIRFYHHNIIFWPLLNSVGSNGVDNSCDNDINYAIQSTVVGAEEVADAGASMVDATVVRMRRRSGIWRTVQSNFPCKRSGHQRQYCPRSFLFRGVKVHHHRNNILQSQRRIQLATVDCPTYFLASEMFSDSVFLLLLMILYGSKEARGNIHVPT